MLTGYRSLQIGLLGKTLSHSLSPLIHSVLADYPYRLYEVAEDQVETFLKQEPFHALNVTIPYKQTVIPFLDELSEPARRIGAVNTITRTKNGGLRGDNTDYNGFAYMLDKSGIAVTGKKVLVFGSGGASLAVRAVLADRNAGQVVVISRKGEDNYTNLERHADAEVLVNTTPLGMYPHNGECPVDPGRFPACEGVLDLIYNPLRTEFICKAESLGIPSANGLTMLAAQAKVACERFLEVTVPDAEIDKVVDQIQSRSENIVLIGMPGCGKSTAGKLLAADLGRPFVDLDEVIVERAGKSIPEIFAERGEAGFRELEHQAVCDIGKQSGQVIATGGGVVTVPDNYRPLHQNGVLVFLKRDVGVLPTDGRPISQSVDLQELYRRRLPLYRQFCDVELEVAPEVKVTVQRIKEMLL